jgi:hypothetical protein
MGHDIEETEPGTDLRRSIPFFLTAPAGVATAGAMLLFLGAAPLENRWSPITISLTHLFTLGFLSLVAIGSFYVLGEKVLGKQVGSPRLAGVAYFFTVTGIVGLCLGLAQGSIAPVFLAIAALFPGLGCFLWPAIAALRGRGQDPKSQAMRLAVGSFTAAAFLGIWLAHGHGGMKFPGPRALWIGVHLTIALLGWIGGMSAGAFGLRSVHFRSPIALGRICVWGLGSALALLLWDYSGVYALPSGTLSWLTTASLAPLALLTLLVQPWLGIRALSGDPDVSGSALFWRTAFLLAPVSALFAGAALFGSDPKLHLIFGWVALWGWGGMMAHAMLRELTPQARPGRASPRSSGLIEHYGGYLLHLTSLVLAIVATLTASDAIAMTAGFSLIAVAAEMWRTAVRSLRVNGPTG